MAPFNQETSFIANALKVMSLHSYGTKLCYILNDNAANVSTNLIIIPTAGSLERNLERHEVSET